MVSVIFLYAQIATCAADALKALFPPPSTQCLPAGLKACCRACICVAGRWKKLGAALAEALRQHTAKQLPQSSFELL